MIKLLTILKRNCFVLLLGGVLLFSNCMNDKLSFVVDKNKKFAYEISYEVETATTHKFSRNDEVSIIHQINQMPVVNRQKVHLGIKVDGSVEWTITKQRPTRPFDWKSDALPSTNAETQIIRIIGNTATCFDSKGAQIYTFGFENHSMKGFLDSLKKGKNGFEYIQNQIRNNNQLKSVNSKLVITPINDSIVSYSKIIDASDNMPEIIGKKYEKVVNINKGVVLGEAIFNEEGTFYFKSVNRYPAKLAELPIPLTTRSQKFEVNKEGILDITTTICRYENVQLINNLNN